MCVPTYGVCTYLWCVYLPIVCVPTYGVCTYLWCVYLPMVCVPTYGVCTYLWCVYLPMVCVPTYGVCTYLWCVYLPIVCVPTHGVCTYLPAFQWHNRLNVCVLGGMSGYYLKLEVFSQGTTFRLLTRPTMIIRTCMYVCIYGVLYRFRFALLLLQIKL